MAPLDASSRHVQLAVPSSVLVYQLEPVPYSVSVPTRPCPLSSFTLLNNMEVPIAAPHPDLACPVP